MAGKKHPILTVMVILSILALLLGGVLALVRKVFPPSAGLPFGQKISVIPIKGAISDSQAILAQLQTDRKDKRVKAIILRIDSPGGAVGPTQEIYREIRRTAKTKKVVASLGGVAASGGYYIAAATHKIVANPATITGSIGVIMHFVRFEDLLKKIGISFEVLKTGEFKDIGSPHRELTERDRDILQAVLADIQDQFVEAVANARKMPIEKVRPIADGRIFTGAKAKELGLVDALGNFQDAVDMAKKLAGLKGDVELVYPRKSGLALWDLFLERTAQRLSGILQGPASPLEYRWVGAQD